MKLKLLPAVIFLVFSFSLNAQKNIAFIINDEGFSTLQTGVIDALESQNYNVTLVSTTSPFDFAALDTFGIVVISRTVYSSTFNQYEEWAALEVPVLMLSPYVLGSDALGFMLGDWSGVALSDEGTPTTLTQAVPLVNDDIFLQVTSDGAPFDFYTSFYNYIGYRQADFEANSNTGIPILALVDDTPLGGDSAVIMARWNAEVETFDGSGVTNAAIRSFLCLGADIWQGAVNFDNYTPASLQLLLNEVAYLFSLSKNYVPTSINFIKESNAFNVFPNPSKNGYFTLTLNSVDTKNSLLQIYNMVGKMVYSCELETKERTTINSGLSKGVYCAIVTSSGKRYSKKLVVD